jgi:hypothetical protein
MLVPLVSLLVASASPAAAHLSNDPPVVPGYRRGKLVTLGVTPAVAADTSALRQP